MNNQQSILQFIRGYIINKLIEDRVKHPELYIGNGTCRKWSLELMRDHINKYK